jgi:hypothetical protein
LLVKIVRQQTMLSPEVLGTQEVFLQEDARNKSSLSVEPHL